MPFYRLYRSSPRAEAANGYDERDHFFREADRERPVGRLPRHGALFCAPTFEAMLGWAETAAHNADTDQFDVPLWELHFAGDYPFVYCGARWSRAARRTLTATERRAQFASYWANAVRLDDFLAGRYREGTFLYRSSCEVLADERSVLEAVLLQRDGTRA
jgi:hypothetical protein